MYYLVPQFLTQFTLRDNLKTGKPIATAKLTDIAFLDGILLERAGLQVSAFYAATIHTRHLTAGKLNDYKDKTLLNSYKSYLYHTLLTAGKPSEQ